MLSLALTSLFTLFPAGVGQDAPQATAPESAAEDVEIMRRLLVESIDATRPTDVRWLQDPAATLDLTTSLPLTGGLLDASVVTHSRGFHAPGSGALFSFDASVPSVQTRIAAEPEDDSDQQDDAWERVRRELKTGQTAEDVADPLTGRITSRSGYLIDTFRTAQDVAWTLDAQAIDQVTEAVLQVLASHGKRMRGLDQADTITVALHFSPSSTPAPYILGDVAPEAEQDGTQYWGSWVKLYGASQAPAQRVVIQASLDELRSLNGGGREQLKRRAKIHRY